jgi:hypothetical protein
MNLVAKYFYRFIGLKINTDGSSDFQSKQQFHLNKLETGWLKFLIYDLFFKVFIYVAFIPATLYVSHGMKIYITLSTIFLIAVFLKYSVRREIERTVTAGRPLKPDNTSSFIKQVVTPTGLIYNNGEYSIKKMWLTHSAITSKTPMKICEELYIQELEKFIDFQVCGIIIAFVYTILSAFIGKTFFIGDAFFYYSILIFILIAILIGAISIRSIHKNILKDEGI